MKKLISVLASLSVSTLMVNPIISCSVFGVTKHEIASKLDQVMQDTSNAFKGAILNNSQGYNGKNVDAYLNKLSINNLDSTSTSNDSFNTLLNTYFNENEVNNFLSENIYGKENFNSDDTSTTEKIANFFLDYKWMINLFLGDSLSPSFAASLIPIGLTYLNYDNLSILQTIQGLGLNDLIYSFASVSVPDIKGMKIVTNEQLKYFALGQLSSLFNFLFKSKQEDFDITESINNSKNIEEEYIKYNKQLFIENNANNEEQKVEIKLASIITKWKILSVEDKKIAMQYLMNFVFALNWYLEPFMAESLSIDSKQIKDQNHVFSNTKSNVDVIKEVNDAKINTNVFSDLNLNNIFTIINSLFLGSASDDNYELNKILKVLFQVGELPTQSQTQTAQAIMENDLWKINDDGSVKFGSLSQINYASSGFFAPYFSSKISGSIMIGANSGEGVTPNINSFANILTSLMLNAFTNINYNDWYNDVVMLFIKSFDNIKLSGNYKEFYEEAINKLILQVKSQLTSIQALTTQNENFASLLVNTSIRTIISTLKLDGSFPVQLPNMSANELMEMKLASGYSIHDILGAFVRIIQKFSQVGFSGAFVKLGNIFNQLFDTSWYENAVIYDENEQVIDNNFGFIDETEQGPEFNKSLWNSVRFLNKNNEETIPNIVFIEQFVLSDKFANELTIHIDNLGNTINKKLSSKDDLINYILGIDYTEDMNINENAFRTNTLMGDVATLWEKNEDQESVISILMDLAENVATSLVNQINSNKERKYRSALNYANYQTQLISYENFKKDNKDSTLIYKIKYASGSISNEYRVELKLPKNSDKYEIISFAKM